MHVRIVSVYLNAALHFGTQVLSYLAHLNKLEAELELPVRC